MGARPRVKRYMGYQAVVTAAPGHLLLGGVKVTRSTPFETRDMAQRFADQAVAANRAAGRDAFGRVVLASSRTPPISRSEVGENPRRRRLSRFVCSGRSAGRTVRCRFKTDDPRKADAHFERYDHDVSECCSDRGCHSCSADDRCSSCAGRGPCPEAYNNPRRRRHGRSNPGPRVVYNRLLGGWYVVTGPHQTPIGGRYASREAAQASLFGPRPARRRYCSDRYPAHDPGGCPDCATGNPEPSTARFRALVRYASGLRPRSWGTYAAQYGDWLMGKGPLPRRPEGMDSATSDRILAAVARIYDVRDTNPRARHERAPRGGRAVLIYPEGRLTGSWYGRHRNGGLYKHRFTHQHAAIYGLPDGSIIVTPREGRLWKNFER